MSAGASPVPAERDPSAADASRDDGAQTPERSKTPSGPAPAAVTMTPVQNDQQQTPERDSVERLEYQLAQMTLQKNLAGEGITAAEARAAAAEERAAAAEARAAEAVRRERIKLVAAVAAARAVATAVAVASALAGAARVPAAEARQPRRTIKGSLNQKGIYVYHVGCLTVTFIDTSGRMYHQPWCVVKVGKADKNTLDQRLQGEESDIKKWRGSPLPRINTRSLTENDDDDVGDLVACFHGPSWVRFEDLVRKRLGIPLGEGKVVHDENVKEMKEQHENSSDLLLTKFENETNGKIQVSGWSRFLFPEGKGIKSKIGPTELIMMPEHAMLRLRGRFQNNPAEFAEEAQPDMQQKRGPAWDYIQEAKVALPETSDWHGEKDVTVQFTTDGLIGPLTSQLYKWKPDPDDEEEEGDDEENSVTFDKVNHVTKKAVKKLSKLIGEGFGAMTDKELEAHCASHNLFGPMETIQKQKVAIATRKKAIVRAIIKVRDSLR